MYIYIYCRLLEWKDSKGLIKDKWDLKFKKYNKTREKKNVTVSEKSLDTVRKKDKNEFGFRDFTTNF